MKKLIFFLSIFLISFLANAEVCKDFSKNNFDSEYTEYHFAKICKKTLATTFNDYKIEKANYYRLQKIAKKINGEPVLQQAILNPEDCENKTNQLSNLTDLTDYRSQKVTIFNQDHESSVYKDGNYFNTTGLFQIFDSQMICENGKPCNYLSNGTLINVDSVQGMREHLERELGKRLKSNGVVTVPMHSLYSDDGKCRKFPLTDMEIRFSNCPNGNCSHQTIKFSDALCSTSECVDQILNPEKDLCVLIPKNQPRNITPVNYSTKGIEEDGVTYVAGYSPYMVKDYLKPKMRNDIGYFDRIISETRFLKRDNENKDLFMHRANTWTSSSGKGVYYVYDGEIRYSGMHIQGEGVENSNGKYETDTEIFNPKPSQANRAIDIGRAFKSLKSQSN